MANEKEDKRVLHVDMPVFPDINLQELGISQEVAAQIRAQFATFEEDWSDPALDIYNDYDAAVAWLRANERKEADDEPAA